MHRFRLSSFQIISTFKIKAMPALKLTDADVVEVDAVGVRAIFLFRRDRPAHHQLVHSQSIVPYLHFGLVGDSLFFGGPGHPQDNFLLEPVVVILEKLNISLELLDIGTVTLVLLLGLAQFLLQQFVLFLEHVLPDMRVVRLGELSRLFIDGSGVFMITLLALGLRVSSIVSFGAQSSLSRDLRLVESLLYALLNLL